MSGRHEGRGLLVSRQYQLNARLPQRLDDVEILFAGHAEDILDAFLFEARNKNIRCFGHGPARVVISMERVEGRRALAFDLSTHYVIRRSAMRRWSP